MRRLSSIVGLLVAMAASIATQQPSRRVGGTLGPVDVTVPAEGQVRRTLTVAVPEAVVRKLSSFALTVHTQVPFGADTGGWVETAEAPAGSRVVAVEIRGDHPSMDGELQVAEGRSAFLNVGAPMDACAPHADCTWVYTLVARTADPLDVPITWTVMSRAGVERAVEATIALTLDPP